MLGPCLWCGPCCPFWCSKHLSNEEVAGCLTLIMFWQSVPFERCHMCSVCSL